MKQFNNAINHAILIAAAIFAINAQTVAYAQNDVRAQNSGAQNSIQSLSVSGETGGKLIIKVGLKEALTNVPAGFTINTPPRIAFDFQNTTNGLGKSTQDFSENDLRSANIVQAGTRTRLVVNLNQMLSYETKIDGNNLLITLQSKAPSVAADTTTRFAEAKPSEQQHGLRDVDFHRGKNGEGRVQIDLSDANVGIDIKQQGKNLIVDFTKTSLPRNLQRKLDVVDFGTPVEGIDTFVQGDNVRMVIEPKGRWEHSAYQTDNKFIVEVKPIIEIKEEKDKKKGYSGEKLTLNFQSITVREALSVIADFTDLNMVIADSVTGNLTLRLKDVPWDQALDIILQSKGLDMRQNGNVIQVAPREELASKEKLNLAANQEIAELEPVHTESFQLSYQKAETLAAMLTNEKQPLLSKRGSAVVDARTNTVFIKDTPSGLEEARKLIQQIDVPIRQVMIEARFVEAGDSFNHTLGGKLGYKGQAVAAGNGSVIGGQNVLAAPNVNLPGATSGTGGLTLSIFDSLATKVLTLELTASETDGTTKAIASPRVVTGDSTEATIKSGVQVPYTVYSTLGIPTTVFKDASLILTTTPQITPDDRVNMKIKLNQDTVGNIYNGVPSINNKEVSTQVLVENGGTVVIGGVYTQEEVHSNVKVPLFGDIPIIGWFFKNENKFGQKKELLVFITPKILKDSLNLH